MSKTKKTRRGRPEKPLMVPANGTFTVNDLVESSGLCRVTVYSKLKGLIRARKIRRTGYVITTGERGKPLDEFESVASYQRAKARKAKLASLPPVEVKTETPEPVTA